MNVFCFFVESIRVANKFGRASHEVDPDSAERLINKYCDGRHSWQGQSAHSKSDTITRGTLPDRA